MLEDLCESVLQSPRCLEIDILGMPFVVHVGSLDIIGFYFYFCHSLVCPSLNLAEMVVTSPTMSWMLL